MANHSAGVGRAPVDGMGVAVGGIVVIAGNSGGDTAVTPKRRWSKMLLRWVQVTHTVSVGCRSVRAPPPLWVPVAWAWSMVRSPSFKISLIWTLGSNPDLACLVLLYDLYVQSIEKVLVIGYVINMHDWDIFVLVLIPTCHAFTDANIDMTLIHEDLWHMDITKY